MFANRKKKPFIPATRLATLVAEGVEILGDVRFTEGMRIDGRVEGDVTGHAAEGSASLLVLSAAGCIAGSVRCTDAVINGTVEGDLDVEHRLELQSEARVTGTIRYRQLQMDVGAAVTGQLVKVETTPAGAKVVELGAEKSGERRQAG
jgi:cytoskeletal protein CcmA (bactofilin family)